MNKTNLLSEGFFDWVIKNFNLKAYEAKAIRKDKTVKSSLRNLNKSTKDLETVLKKDYGIDVKLDKYTLKDFV